MLKDRICGCVTPSELNTRPVGTSYIPGGVSKDGKPMFIVCQSRLPVAPSGGAKSRKAPGTFDLFGRQIGGNWPALDAAARINRPSQDLSTLPEFPDFGLFDLD